MRMKTIGIILLLFLGHIQNSSADYPKTDADYAFLPPLCKARSAGPKSPDYQMWVKRVGEDFNNVHHYCAGLHTLNLALKEQNPSEQQAKFRGAVNEISYVPSHSAPDFKLLPRIFYDMGQVYQYMGQIDDAIEAQQKSISLYQKTSFPYAALSDLYEKKNMKSEAKSILETGLKHNPNSKILIKRLKKFK